MNYFWDDVGIPLLVIGSIWVSVLGGIFVISHFYGQYQCANFQQITGKETRWASFDACYIKVGAGWERWGEYKLRAAASEGLNVHRQHRCQRTSVEPQ